MNISSWGISMDYKYFVTWCGSAEPNSHRMKFVEAPSEEAAIEQIYASQDVGYISNTYLVLNDHQTYNRSIHIELHDGMYSLELKHVLPMYAREQVAGTDDQYEDWLVANQYIPDEEIIDFLIKNFTLAMFMKHAVRVYKTDPYEENLAIYLSPSNHKIV